MNLLTSQVVLAIRVRTGLTSTGDIGERAEKGLPPLTQIIMLIQAVANGVLVFWVFKEYLNNQYLQTYVGTFVAANMVALDLTMAGIAGLAVVFVAKFRNVIRSREQSALLETVIPAGVPVRARAETRAKLATEPSSNGTAASDALANAAARVFRQMELGQGPTASAVPPTPPTTREAVEQRPTPERKLSLETHPPTLRRFEHGQPSVSKPWPEKRSPVQMEEDQRRDQRTWPLIQRAPTVSTRQGPIQSMERQAGQQHSSSLTPTELGRSPTERFSPPPMLKRAGTGSGPENKPSLQLPQPMRHMESGPLDNPLPTNPLLPILRREPEGYEHDPFLHKGLPGERVSEPGQAALADSQPQSLQPAAKGLDHSKTIEKPPAEMMQPTQPPAQEEKATVETPLVEKRLPFSKREESGRGQED